MRLLATTAIVTALAASPALAEAQQQTQTTSPQAQQRAQQSAKTELQFVREQKPNEISAEWLTGSAVYNMQEERLGNVNDVILGRDGEISAVVIGVGGFLGIGEKDVAVEYESLEFRPAPAGSFGAARDTAPRTSTDRTQQGTTAQPRTQQQTGVDQPRDDVRPGARTDQGTAADQPRDQAMQPGGRQAQPGATAQQDDQRMVGQPDQRTAADQPRGQVGQTGQTAQGELRIYLNATREQLENAPEFSRLEGQTGVFGGPGSAN